MNLKELRRFAGDDVAQDAMDDLAVELQETRNRADTYYRGEHEIQCTCAPPHKYQMREGKCPAYVAKLETLLRKIRQTGFICNTAHKLRAEIDEVLQ